MRLRLVHTLTLLFASMAVAAVLALGGWTAVNLRNGFADVLAARDADRLEQFAALVGEQAEAAGGADALTEGRLDMRVLLRRFADRLGTGAGILPPGPRGRPGARLPGLPGRGPFADVEAGSDGGGAARADGPPPRGFVAADDAALGLPPPPLNPRPGPDGRLPVVDGRAVREGVVPPAPGTSDVFADRVVIVDLQGRPLVGRPLPPDVRPALDRPIAVDGRVVALARLAPGVPVPDAVEARFLRRQYLGIAGVTALLVALAVAIGVWTARRFARPLLAAQAATARLARGELGVRVRHEGPAAGLARTDEIGDVVRNIDRMAESLQRLEGARRRWLADLSHELRTPLAVLRGEVEALIDGVRPTSPAALGSLHEDLLRLQGLVEDLHLLAMSDLDALPCHPVDADAAEIVAAAATRFQGRAAAAGHRLETDLPAGGAAAGLPALPVLPVQWDPARIGQLLGNLVENAVRYTDAPGRIVLSARRAGPRVILTVDDTAPGVPEPDRARLFEPLFRADAARARHSGGSGLGLAICEAIARGHGGRINAEASPLGGLRARVDLPDILPDRENAPR